MTRESAASKGRRYLVEGRLCLTHLDQDDVSAWCRGDSGEIYDVGHDFCRGWFCSCAARGDCAHLGRLAAGHRPDAPAPTGSLPAARMTGRPGVLDQEGVLLAGGGEPAEDLGQHLAVRRERLALGIDLALQAADPAGQAVHLVV